MARAPTVWCARDNRINEPRAKKDEKKKNAQVTGNYRLHDDVDSIV